MVYYFDTQTSTGIREFADKLSEYTHAGYATLWTNAKNDYCSDFSHYLDKVRGDETCKSLDEHGNLIKDYCGLGDNITKTECGKNSLTNYGHLDIYNDLAKEYCEANPDKDFCACYNVLNNKCLTEETKDLPGCKVTYPTRETINNMPAEYSSNFEGTDKCWGNVCAAGSGKYVPDGAIDALCSKTVAVCIADLDVSSLKDSGVNIEQNCGSNNQTSTGTPSPSTTPSTTPSTSNNVPLNSSSTPSTNGDGDGDEDEEEKAFYEKTEVQIGAGAFSSISCLFVIMLLIIALM